jgi:predicted metalloenzyme YecM
MKESANALQISNPATQSPAIAQDSSQKMSPQELRIQQSKKQLTEDTAKLLQLANELKVEMDKSTKDTLSLSVVKKAEQVEKMAHRVRDEMKLTLGN